MRLRPQPVTGQPQILPDDDDSLDTGFMTDCVSAIVLFDYGARGYSARGWHGLGGAHNIDWAALMDGIPDDSRTRVLIIPGESQQAEEAMRGTRECAQGVFDAHPHTIVEWVMDCRQVTVHRDGQMDCVSPEGVTTSRSIGV